MAGRIAPHEPHPALGPGSRYQRGWLAVAKISAAVWGFVAVLETPRLPLLFLVTGLGAFGGILFVRDPGTTAAGRRQYVTGALIVAAGVLMTIGVGHHLMAGLALATLLAGSSPWLIRWIAGS